MAGSGSQQRLHDPEFGVGTAAEVVVNEFVYRQCHAVQPSRVDRLPQVEDPGESKPVLR